MLTRRHLLLTTAAVALSVAIATRAPAAFAQSAEQSAQSFVQQTAKALIDVVNGPGSAAQKQAALTQVIDHDVDVADVARFCLGRFWRTATPEQQKEYVDLFHRVLVLNITGKVGEYSGVSIVVGRAAPREGEVSVASTVTRPNNAPSRVDWLVSTASGAPMIVDVIAEGTSLRLTQRSDYASYLAHNNNNVAALISAMRQQAQQAG
jgi:phospholipid transport system substrate-binding protein